MVLTSEPKLSLEYSSLTLVMAPVEDQVTSSLVETSHSSPPLGAVRVSVRWVRMVKSASETSLTSASLASLTRTRTVVEASLGTVQLKVPSSAVEELMVLTSVSKLSVEYSSLTLVMAPVEDQVMSWLEAPSQLSPPSGAVSVRVRRVAMAKLASEVSLMEAVEASLTRTRTVLDTSLGMVQA